MLSLENNHSHEEEISCDSTTKPQPFSCCLALHCPRPVRLYPAPGRLQLGTAWLGHTAYLAHREAVETYLREQEAAFETLKETLRHKNPQMAQRIATIKQLRQTTRS